MEKKTRGIKVSRKDVGLVLETILEISAKRVTKYLRPDFVISAHRKSFRGKIDDRDKIAEIVVKIGNPNYAEREFIKLAKKAGEPFPIKKLQFKFFTKK